MESFFQSLAWGYTRGVLGVDLVPFGQLMMILNLRERWIYQGSETIPPCQTGVYWNVLTSVYPISQKVYDDF